MLETEDALLDQGWRDLVGCCLAYLRRRGDGDEYYPVSLAPAAVWGSPRVGGVPDRRYNLAVSEADLHGAMLTLPLLNLTAARLSREEKPVAQWTRKWDDHLGRVCGDEWWSYRDAQLWGIETKARYIAVARTLNGLIASTAVLMATHLGDSWLRAG